MPLDYPKVLLISALAKAGYNIAPGIGLYQLQHYVQQRGVPCEFVDRELTDIDEYLVRVEAGEFDIVGFSVTRVNMLEDLKLIWTFKQAVIRSGRKVMFIVGGQEAVQNHDQWLDFGIDAVIIGYAEKMLLEFCCRLRNCGGVEVADIPTVFGDMAGIAFKRPDGTYVFNPAPMLDEAGFRELFYTQRKTLVLPFQKYWERMRREISDYSVGGAEFTIENVRILTSSHCPRGCGFCNSQTFLPISFGGPTPIIMLSADEIIDLVLMHIDSDGARSFLFSDDDFPISNKAGLNRLQRFCERIIELKASGRIDQNMRFSCQSRLLPLMQRADSHGNRHPNLWLIRLMVKAGFLSIGLGVETFIDRLMLVPSIRKLGYTAKDSQDVLDTLIEEGLSPQINLILGIPEYTPEELCANMDIAISYIVRGCDVAVNPRLKAMPCAPIWNKGLYEIQYSTWDNPMTGKTEKIPMFYIAKDPQVAESMNNYDEAQRFELNRVVKRKGWEGKTIHKRVIGVTAMIGVAKSLGNYEQVERFRCILDGIVDNEKDLVSFATRHSPEQEKIIG